MNFTKVLKNNAVRRASWPVGQYLQWVDSSPLAGDWFMCSFRYRSEGRFEFFDGEWAFGDWEPYTP